MADNDDQACRVGIVIVEDEKDIVKMYLKAFAKKGIGICFVSFDGLDAVKRYMECDPKPQTVVMDYRLPVMDGIDATKEILKTDPDARIIFLSADLGVKEEAMNAGAFTFLKKPVSLNDITSAVKSADRKSVV
jgi:two-component system, chemotaxis family, chemotaxis protein CheY